MDSTNNRPEEAPISEEQRAEAENEKAAGAENVQPETQAGTPNISMPEAMPANSENVVHTLPISRHSMASAVSLMPKRSRMSATTDTSASPLSMTTTASAQTASARASTPTSGPTR